MNSRAKNTESSTQNDDEACRKLWEIYVTEAKQYDEALIKSWKEDMDVILVFSGLYSAVLTAFVIESYQSLQVDQTENSAVLLRRISEQLASPGSNVTLTPLPDSAAFSPNTAALACNILWFMSLALALSAAFLATILQQMTRRFLHRTSVVHSMSARAHLLQFLYFGIKKFGMHTLVEIIPSFLHLSLFSFFAGLIAFFHNVNHLLSWLFAGVFSLALTFYLVLSILPIVDLSSPYATPFSPLLWHLWRFSKSQVSSWRVPLFQVFSALKILPGALHGSGNPHSSADDDTEAQHSSPSSDFVTTGGWRGLKDAVSYTSRVRRNFQESACVIWTYRSLNEDTEMLSFIEAFPDTLMEGQNFRTSNLHLLKPLLVLEGPRGGIVASTFQLMKNAQNPWHSEEHRKHCATATSHFLYIVARFLVQYQDDLLPENISDSAPFTNTYSIPREMLQFLKYGTDYQHVSTARSAYALFTLGICSNARRLLFTSTRLPAVVLEGVMNQLGASSDAMGISFVDPHACIKSLLSRYLSDYITALMEVKDLPEFVTVCKLFVDNGAVPRILDWHNSWFTELVDHDQDTRFRYRTKPGLDTVFCMLLDSADHDAIAYPWLIAYVSRRVRYSHVGCTGFIWNSSRMLRFSHITREAPMDILLDVEAAVALWEVYCHIPLAHVEPDCEAIIYPMMLTHWLELTPFMTPISFFIPLLSLDIQRDHRKISPSINCIVAKTIALLESDQALKGVDISIVNPRWALVLLGLDSQRLSLRHVREVLQYFCLGTHFYISPPRPAQYPILYAKLVHFTDIYGKLWLDRPSVDLHCINAMIWELWTSFIDAILKDLKFKTPLIDKYKTLAIPKFRFRRSDDATDMDAMAAWSELKPLLAVSKTLLAPDSLEQMEKYTPVDKEIKAYVGYIRFPGFPISIKEVQLGVLELGKHPAVSPCFVKLPPVDEEEFGLTN